MPTENNGGHAAYEVGSSGVRVPLGHQAVGATVVPPTRSTGELRSKAGKLAERSARLYGAHELADAPRPGRVVGCDHQVLLRHACTDGRGPLSSRDSQDSNGAECSGLIDAASATGRAGRYSQVHARAPLLTHWAARQRRIAPLFNLRMIR